MYHIYAENNDVSIYKNKTLIGHGWDARMDDVSLQGRLLDAIQCAKTSHMKVYRDHVDIMHSYPGFPLTIHQIVTVQCIPQLPFRALKLGAFAQCMVRYSVKRRKNYPINDIGLLLSECYAPLSVMIAAIPYEHFHMVWPHYQQHPKADNMALYAETLEESYRFATLPVAEFKSYEELI